MADPQEPAKKNLQSRPTQAEFREHQLMCARVIQQQLASDSFWDLTEKISDALRKELRLRKQLQRFARKHATDPLALLEYRLPGSEKIPPAYLPPATLPVRTRGQLLALAKIVTKQPQFLMHPYFYLGAQFDEAEAPETIDHLKWIVAGVPGNKCKEIYRTIKNLRDSGKYDSDPHWLHKICLVVDVSWPDKAQGRSYQLMNVPEQRAARKRVRRALRDLDRAESDESSKRKRISLTTDLLS